MKGKKGILIGVGAAVAVLVIGLVLFLTLGKKDVYRIIKIFEVSGTASVVREKIGEIEPYANMVLESGDNVSLDTGEMTLRLDEDKYIYVEEQTEFELVAEGTAENSKTSINLIKGALTNEIQNKLSDESTYEVNVPNSTMSVRGTIFRVETYEDENHIKYTKVSVFSGKVDTRLTYSDGTVSDDVVSVEQGKEVIIYEDGVTTDYLGDPRDIDYSEFPKEVVELLITMCKEGADLGITIEELEDYLNPDEEPQGPFTVTFMYNGTVFGTQTVNKGDCAQKPALMPQASGDWDFDFTSPITEDTVINWK